jgi:hypothetical protein
MQQTLALVLVLFACSEKAAEELVPSGASGSGGSSAVDDARSGPMDGGTRSDSWLVCEPLTPERCEPFRLGCPELAGGREQLEGPCPFGESTRAEGVACGTRVLLSHAGFSQTDILYYDLDTDELVGVWAMEEESRETSCLGQVPRDCASQHATGWGPLPVDWCRVPDAG